MSAFRALVAGLCIAGVGGYVYINNMNSHSDAVNPPRAAGQPRELRLGDDERTHIEYDVRKLMRARDFDKLESLSNAMRANDERTSEGRPKLASFYSATEDELTELEKTSSESAVNKFLEDWKKKIPESITQVVVDGSYKITVAWRARGGGYANTVRPEQWEVFGEKLKEAYTTLVKAQGGSGTFDPQASASMLLIGMAAGMPREKADEIVEECIKRYPTYDGVYRSMADYLLPRWQGEPGDVEEFADDMQKKLPAPLGDIIYARIFGEAWDYTGYDVFRVHSFSYPKILAGYNALFKQYPDSIRARKSLAYIATNFNDRDTAAKMLHETENYWPQEEIIKMWDTTETFDKVNVWADKGGNNPMVISPLELAIEAGSMDAVTSAVLAGYDVNTTLVCGTKPLLMSVQGGKKEISAYLISKGAEINDKGANGGTVAEAACEANDVDTIKLLQQHGYKLSDEVNQYHGKIQQTAALVGADKVLEYALSQPGVDPNEALEEDGQTPLMMAAARNKVDCLKVLLKYNAEINAKNHHNLNALHYAASNGSAEAIKFLLKMGADPMVKTDGNLTALDMAKTAHKAQSIELLEEAMAKKP